MPRIDFAVDASQGVAAAGQYNTALDATINRFGKLAQVTNQYSASGTLYASTIEAQVGKFTKLTQRLQLVDGALKVVNQSYKDNIAAAERFAAASLAAQKASVVADIAKNAADRKTFYDFVAKAEQEQQARVTSSLAAQKLAEQSFARDANASRKVFYDYVKQAEAEQIERVTSSLAAQKAASIAATQSVLASRKVLYDYIKQAEAEQQARVTASLAAQKSASISATQSAIAARQTLAAFTQQENDRDAQLFQKGVQRAAAARTQREREDAEYNSRVRARGGNNFIGGPGGGPPVFAGGPSDKDNERAGIFNGHMNRIQRNLVQFASFRAFNFISSSFEEGIKGAKDFQIQLSLIRTISQENQQSASKFGQDVRGVSDASGIDIAKVGKAFYDTVSNQIAKGAAVQAFVKTAADLSRVTGSELPDSTNLLSSAINAYGLSVSDADRLSAIFFRTIDEGRIVAGELANTFGRVGVLGSNLGVSIEDLNSVLAITTQKGFKTADAMTLLTNLLIKLEKPTEATKGFFKDLGVETGEGAIRLYGFTGVLQKMVDAVKSGKVDVSAFFDEIRGRKQFGIFEQSIGDIKRFSTQLKDVSGTAAIYEKAKVIRGESPADLLVKETNKLANVIKVDLGQAIIGGLADFIKYTGGVEGLTKVAERSTTVLKVLGTTLVAYGASAVAATAINLGFVGSLKAITIAATSALKTLLPFALVYAGFKAGQGIFSNRSVADLGFDPKDLNASSEALERYNKQEAQYALARRARAGEDVGNVLPFKGLEDQKTVVEDTFKGVLGYLAQATIANNKFLEEAKSNSVKVSDALKVSFAGWTDTLKTNISEIKKGIHDAQQEIEKGAKSQVKYKDTIEDVLQNTRLKYATDDIRIGNQKEQVLNERIKRLTDRATNLFSSTNKEEVDEGRRLFDEIANLEQQKFDVKTDFQRRQFEENQKQFYAQNPGQRPASGFDIFGVDTLPLQKRLNDLLQYRTQLEKENAAAQTKVIASKRAELAVEEARLRTLEQAFKAYEEIEIFKKTGGIKEEFATSDGRLDKSKLSKAFDETEAKIRANAGGTFEARVALEIKLAEFRKSIFAQAQAEERAEYLKSTQARVISEQEAATKRLDDIKKARQEQIDTQRNLATALGQKPAELTGFAKALFDTKKVSTQEQDEILGRIINYREALRQLYEDGEANKKNGVVIYDPAKIEFVRDLYNKAIDSIEAKRDSLEKNGKAPDLRLTLPDGTLFSPDQGRKAIGQQTAELLQSRNKLASSNSEEDVVRDAFQLQIKDKIEGTSLHIIGGLDIKIGGLNQQIPGLAVKADDATKSIGESFKSLSNGGMKEFQDRLIEIEKSLNRLQLNPDAKKKVEADLGIEPAYAASGGIVGLFPGQPRGVDKYPIWAAAGERIIDARTSAMYAPMLDAIMNRRAPRYMAAGGIVGGDTNIGDINITVQGGNTNSQTGRSIGTQLERELRRNNIVLKPRR